MSRGKGPTEAEFLRMVIQLAALHGWVTAHFRPLRTARGLWRTACQGQAKGFPDLVCAHPRRRAILVAELKARGGKLTPEQAAWLAAFEACGVPAYLWTFADFEDIERVLSGEDS